MAAGTGGTTSGAKGFFLPYLSGKISRIFNVDRNYLYYENIDSFGWQDHTSQSLNIRDFTDRSLKTNGHKDYMKMLTISIRLSDNDSSIDLLDLGGAVFCAMTVGCYNSNRDNMPHNLVSLVGIWDYTTYYDNGYFYGRVVDKETNSARWFFDVSFYDVIMFNMLYLEPESVAPSNVYIDIGKLTLHYPGEQPTT